MPTAKQWEQVAEMQKPKTAIVPEGNTVNQRIQSMMTDPRYQDKFDTRLRDHVQKQFQEAYPGTVEYDETGKMVQPRPTIMPDDVELTTFTVSDGLETLPAESPEQNTPKPSMTHEKVAQMLKEYKEDPEKFIRVKQANVNQTGGDVQVAFAPVLAFGPWLAGFLSVATAAIAMQIYNQSTSSEQKDYDDAYQDYLDSLDDDTDDGDDDEDRKSDCDYQYEEIDTPRCNQVTKDKGKSAGESCHASASERYSQCLKGVPESQWPRLLT